MRITNSMMISDMLWNSNRNLNSLSKYQNQLSSGQQISRPSDDPVGITKVLKYKTDIRAAEQYSDNITTSLGWLEVSESSTDDVKEILQRVRELTVQAANGTNTDEDTQKIMTEVEQLREEIISLGNSTIAGRYIFSGLETDEPLFNDDGTYNIAMTSQRVKEKNTINFEVYVNEVMDVATYPTDIFGIGEDTSFYNGLISYGSTETTASTRSKMALNVDLTNDYEATGEAVAIHVGTANYDVDMTLLAQSQNDPLTKSDMLAALQDASDGSGGVLSDVATVYYDQNDKLIVEAKVYGSGIIITNTSASAGVSVSSNTTGLDEGTNVFTSDVALHDADIANAEDVNTLMLTLNGEQKAISVDFSSLSTVADYAIALQAEIDSQFPSSGITVAGTDGSNLTFTIDGAADGSVNTLEVDYVVSNESSLINDLDELITALETDDSDVLSNMIGRMDDNLDQVLTALGDIGGKTNRIEFISSRVKDNIITFTSLLSDVQDVDMAQAIMWYKNLENVYKASLSVGAQVIQPSLVDFIS
ncbi:MAG: flagellar hook-associated protein 3 FlgL [Clostridiales bacterium]|nr:flagellar hook-associated protein 3 FlgL [Clostridiales bacterium]